MELWDLYDSERRLTGRTHVRGEKIPDGYHHLVVDVWIRNSQGQYLISQRAASRPTYPLFWECVSGSAITDDDSLTAALREVKEEVGLDLDPASGRVIFSRTRPHFHDILDVWLFPYDGEVDLSRATTDEVAQTRWMTVDEIRALNESGRFVDTLSYFFTEVEN